MSGTVAGSDKHQGRAALERQTSRLTDTLTQIQSADAHPPDNNVVKLDNPTNSDNDPNKMVLEIDIEHVPVEDDPRDWSEGKKWIVLMIMTFAVLGPTMASSIYNPVVNDVRSDLNASEDQIGLSISLYILFQGMTPVFWSAVAEVSGRKPIYLISYAIYVVALIVASRAQSMSVLIAMRVVQATGSGAVVAIGAGSLADMYEVHERGTKLGVFYGIPMLGPGISPLLGGALGQSFGWRSVFYFLASYAFILWCSFLFAPDSWRRERSRVYRKAIARASKRAKKVENANLRRQYKLAKKSETLETIAATPSETPAPSPLPSPPLSTSATLNKSTLGRSTLVNERFENSRENVSSPATAATDLENGVRPPFDRMETSKDIVKNIKPSARDLSPFTAMTAILKRPTNLLILAASGLIFSAQYTIVYTASLTLGAAPYNYSSLTIGLVLLAFGVGNISASILGGRYSDLMLRRLKKKNGGVGVPEMRLKSTIIAMPLVICSSLAYAWTAQEKVHIAGIVVCLFFFGFSILWIYTSTLAYVVDSNPGASSSAVSCNSLFRGIMACVMSQIATPIQDGIGDGGLYTLFAAILAVSCGFNLLLIAKGEQWRSPSYKWPWQNK